MPKLPAPKPPAKKTHFEQTKEDQLHNDETPSIQPRKVILSSRPSIDPPFDRYVDKTWFPQGLNYDVGKIAMALIPVLGPDKPFVLKEIYSFLGQLHQ